MARIFTSAASVREEHLTARLGERFWELDVLLLVEWLDERWAGLLFLW